MMEDEDITVLVLSAIIACFWVCAILVGIIDLCNDVHRSQEGNEDV